MAAEQQEAEEQVAVDQKMRDERMAGRRMGCSRGSPISEVNGFGISYLVSEKSPI